MNIGTRRPTRPEIFCLSSPSKYLLAIVVAMLLLLGLLLPLLLLLLCCCYGLDKVIPESLAFMDSINISARSNSKQNNKEHQKFI